MSKPIIINQYHLGLNVSDVFLLLVGSGEERVDLRVFLGAVYLRKGLAVFSTLRYGMSVLSLK